jgi:quinoprotein glucose dehydrogenase
LKTPWTPSTNTGDKQEPGSSDSNSHYSFTGYRKFLDPDHYPAIAPPWGTLNAIDLNTGE